MSSPEVRPEPPQYTIDDLATASHVPSRTIRFYQSRGALMPPEIRGRVAYYGKPHIERLELIAQLQDRGLRIDAIRDLLSSIDRGELDLAEWLGVEQQLQASWADDQPKTVTEEELYRLAGSRRPGLLGELLRVGVIERHGDVYLLHSPALLTLALKLESVGIDLETAKEAAAVIRKHMRRTVDDLVDLFMKRAGKGLIESKDASALFQALRPSGMEAVRILFGREMEGALRKLLESGKVAALARAPRTKRRR